MFDQGGDSSLNISQDMVRSMSKSMVGSIKSIGNPNLSQSMIDKGNLSIRSSKVIQNVSKKMIEGCNGKDLNTLFDKNKNMSESFMSMSSSGIEGEDTTKIRIKNKKYYDFISTYNFITQMISKANNSRNGMMKPMPSTFSN